MCAKGITNYEVQIQDNGLPSAMEQIKKEIANLQTQIAALSVSKEGNSAKP